ncbi:ABC transporter substrate-binding protein [Thermodesulfobacteriota bacterium]
MNKKRALRNRYFLCIVWLFFFLLITGVSAAEEPKYGGTLRIGVFIPQDRVDVRYLSIPALVPAGHMIYDPLFGWGKKGFENLIPALATDYETKDHKVWTFRLRQGVKFHNGREMTAEDVKTNLDWRITTPPGWKPVNSRQLIRGLKKVEVVDKYTVKIELDQAFAPLPRILAYAFPGVAPPEEVEKWGDKFNFHACGTGPFKLTNLKPRVEVEMERFDEYWGPKPYLDRVIYKFYRSNETRLLALQKGELDLAVLFDDARPMLDKDLNMAYKVGLTGDVLRKLYFNMRRWPMSDIRFRKAVAMGVDWNNVSINAFAFKSGNYARTLLEYTKYFNPEAVKLFPEYNPKEAKKLIQAVERDEGKKIPPIFWLDGTHSQGKIVGEVAKAQLNQIGVPVNLQFLSTAIWATKVLRDPKMEWDIAGFGAGFGLEPSLGFNYFVTDSGSAPDGKSLGGYSNPDFDNWVRKAEGATEKEAIKFYQEAEKILLKDVAAIPLFPNRHVIAYNKKVKGVHIVDSLNICVTTSWANIWINE